jgi:hypothetical protein
MTAQGFTRTHKRPMLRRPRPGKMEQRRQANAIAFRKKGRPASSTRAETPTNLSLSPGARIIPRPRKRKNATESSVWFG